jgi:cytochrome c553
MPSPAQVAARRQRFVLIWGAVCVLALVGLVWYLTYEQTAINTVPRREAAVFMPQMRPQEGDPEVGAAIWETLRCAFCHGAQAEGGPDGQPALRGAPRLTFEAFVQRVRVGTQDMPSFSPEELPDGYLIHLWAWLTAS